MHIRVYERKMCCFFFILNHQVGTSAVICGRPPSDPVSSFAQAHRDYKGICKYI